MFALTMGGEVEDVDEDEGEPAEYAVVAVEPYFGAIAMGVASTLLCAGYPSHCLPDRTHLQH